MCKLPCIKTEGRHGDWAPRIVDLDYFSGLMSLYPTSNVHSVILYHVICRLWGWMDCTIRLNSDKRLDWLQNHSEHNGMRMDGMQNKAEQWQEAGCTTILNTLVWGWIECRTRLNSDRRLDWLQNNSEHNDMRLDRMQNQAEQWQEAGCTTILNTLVWGWMDWRERLEHW